MAWRKNQDYLVTQHRFVTIEPITPPNNAGKGFAVFIGLVIVVVFIAGVVGAFAGH